jgi:hypothetical protein
MITEASDTQGSGGCRLRAPRATGRQHPELFQAHLVAAILYSTKCQTRRPVTARRCVRDGWPTSQKWLDELNFDSGAVRVDGGIPTPYLHVPHHDRDTVHRVYSRIEPGDDLWVRETWSPDYLTVYPCPPRAWYLADMLYDNPVGDTDERGRCTAHDGARPGDCIACRAQHDGEPFRWRPSVHMPKRVCRLWLRVTRVRFERLQSITPEDAWAEGARCVCGDPKPSCSGNRDAFAALWDGVYGGTPLSWRSNRHVLVFDFEKVRP